jgi:hypothetical protein
MNWSADPKLGGHGEHMPPCIYGDVALGARQEHFFPSLNRQLSQLWPLASAFQQLDDGGKI